MSVVRSKDEYVRLKRIARKLRRQGESVRSIESNLKVARSTISIWTKDIKLTHKQLNKLEANRKQALKIAVKRASIVNRQIKQSRLKAINDSVRLFIDDIKLNKSHLEIFLAALYLGEGFKSSGRTGFCNSNPKTVKAFVDMLRNLYNIDESKLRAGIYARFDQKPMKLINFWSKALNIPKSQFHKTQVDLRTSGSATYKGYKGVCAVYYNDTQIKRRLMAIANEIMTRTDSSAG